MGGNWELVSIGWELNCGWEMISVGSGCRPDSSQARPDPNYKEVGLF